MLQSVIAYVISVRNIEQFSNYWIEFGLNQIEFYSYKEEFLQMQAQEEIRVCQNV